MIPVFLLIVMTMLIVGRVGRVPFTFWGAVISLGTVMVVVIIMMTISVRMRMRMRQNAHLDVTIQVLLISICACSTTVAVSKTIHVNTSNRMTTPVVYTCILRNPLIPKITPLLPTRPMIIPVIIDPASCKDEFIFIHLAPATDVE